MSLLDESNRHEIYLARLASGLLNSKIYPSLEEAYKAARLILLDMETLNTPKKLQDALKKVSKSTKRITKIMFEEFGKELDEIAFYEASYHADLTGSLNQVKLTVPSNRKIKTYTDSSLLSLISGQRTATGTWADFVEKQKDAIETALDNQIKAMYVNNETIGQGIARLKQATEGFLRHELEALTRTGLSHYTIQAREVMALDNLDILERRFFNAVFDNRTTLTCAGFAGKTWLMSDQSYPKLPLHWNERSTWIYLTKGQKEIGGTRSALGGQEGEEAENKFQNRKDKTDRKIKYRGRKDSEVFKAGQIDAKTSYDSFMSGQPDWFQNDSLGVKRAQLFRDGKLSLSKFTDMAGEPLTLSELKIKYPAAFKRAGL